MTLVLRLEDALDPRVAGGKAARLARARRLGLPVPDGVVVSARAFEAHLARAGAAPPLARADHDLRPDDPDGLARAAAAFAARVAAVDVDPALLDAVALEAPAIARSSGLGEDAPGCSFAGQLDSIGPVTTRAELARALVAVWSSFASARALAYQLARGARLGGLAVLVQRLVPARRAGVLFTRHPARPATLLIEAVDGPAEDLVQGRVEPTRLEVGRDGPADGLPGDLRGLGLRLEQAFGAPQDVEWVVDPAGAVHVVQSRDQTGAPPRRWTNANLIENFPGPVTPLLASVLTTGYEHLLRGLGRAFGVAPWRLERVAPALRRLVGFHGGRVYYDLTAVREVLAAAPLGDDLAALFERYVGAPPTPPAARGWRDLGSRAGQALEALAIAARVAWLYRDLGARVARFEARVDAYAGATAPPLLVARGQADLLADLRGFVALRTDWVDPGLADVAAMVTSGLLARLLERALPDRPSAPLMARLLGGLEGLVSAGPVDGLWALSRDPALRDALDREPDDRAALAALERPTRRAVDAWLEAWGFRCSGELTLTTPSFQDEPWRALALARAYARDDGGSPAARAAAQAADRREAGAEVRAALPRALRSAFGRLLTATQASIALRERARLKQALLYSRLRRVVMALGERLAARGLLERPDDVWFLGWQELEALALGGALDPRGAREVAALRRRRHAAWPSRVPEVIELAPGDVHDDAADGGEPAPAPGELTGTGAAPGRVTAPARVLEHVAEAGRLGRGDVLVVRQTDPGWAAALFLAGGLVVERGGLLSHGAIVAREYGLPTVIGVRDATRRIAEGQVVTVDGSAGRVRLA
ncbi:MAG: PEP-utilizing enzyme [Planctomycetes bacterium]|nr:PEP-utilizing enzyme [Planctomycetota bacterium]